MSELGELQLVDKMPYLKKHIALRVFMICNLILHKLEVYATKNFLEIFI